MIKMIIVDDEPIIRQGLRETIPWEQYGVTVVAEAQDGREAIDKINQHKDLELVITDVKMPNMDGIALIEALSNHANPPKVIILSGYDEFEYAQQAIKNGVKDYLLKPVDIDELIRTVKALSDSILQEKKQLEEVTELTIRSTLIQDIYGSVPSLSDTPLNKSVFPFLTSIRNFMAQVEEEEDRSTIQVKAQKTVLALLEKKGMTAVSHFFSENVLLACVYKWDEAALPTTKGLKEILDQIKGEDFEYYFIVGKDKTNLSELPDVYKELYERLQNAYIEVEPYEAATSLSELPDFLKEAVILSLNRDWKEVEHAVLELFKRLQKGKIRLDQVEETCQEVLNRAGNVYKKNLSYEQFRNLNLNYIVNVDTNLYNSYQLLQELFLNDLNQIYMTLHDQAESHHWLVDRALNYIDQYYNYDIKASEVADYINISPNYFSGVFKQHTGLTFNDYLNQLRIEKAQMLLEETQDKINTIAEQVGYQNYKYFVQIFKQRTNMTPTEYRKFTSVRS